MGEGVCRDPTEGRLERPLRLDSDAEEDGGGGWGRRAKEAGLHQGK